MINFFHLSQSSWLFCRYFYLCLKTVIELKWNMCNQKTKSRNGKNVRFDITRAPVWPPNSLDWFGSSIGEKPNTDSIPEPNTKYPIHTLESKVWTPLASISWSWTINYRLINYRSINYRSIIVCEIKSYLLSFIFQEIELFSCNRVCDFSNK